MKLREVIERIEQEKYDFSKAEMSLDRSNYKEGYNDASDDIIEIFKQLDEPKEISWRKAISVLEHHFQCEIPRNLDQVIEGFNSMSGLMNTVEFELDKQGSKLTSKEFVLEALERYKQKVKVPECVGKDLDAFTKARLKEDLVKDICLAVYDYSQGTPFVTATVKWCRKGSNLRTMIDAIWNGYEVEEEPKWVVKRKDNGKYVESLALGKGIGLIAETTASLQENAYKLNSKDQADAVAVLIDGKVEKV